MLIPRGKVHLTKTPRLAVRISLLKCWPELSKRLPKHTAYVVVALGYTTGPAGNSVLLMTPHTLKAGHRDLSPRIYLKAPSLKTN